MSGKKTELIGFRLSPNEKEALETVAKEYGLTPGSLAGMLCETFMKARKSYGRKLVWPPEFNYFTGSETGQNAQEKRDAFEKAG